MKQPAEARGWRPTSRAACLASLSKRQLEIPAEAQLTVFRVANEAAERARPPMRLTLVAGCAADFRHVDEMLAWPCWRLQDKENLKTFSACLYPHCCLAAKQIRL